MSTSDKSPNTIRQGGPGASHENAKAPLQVDKPGADPENRPQRSGTSGGGGEEDSHHSRNERQK